MNMSPTILNISVEEIIKIQNILIELRDFMKSDKHHRFDVANDPLFKYLSELHKVEISTSIEKKQRINLHLKTQILDESNKLVKCEH